MMDDDGDEDDGDDDDDAGDADGGDDDDGDGDGDDGDGVQSVSWDHIWAIRERGMDGKWMASFRIEVVV